MMLRVLVVDDEPLARRGIARRLSVHADVELAGEAGDGDTAIDAIREHAPDLMFLDVEMPGMSGLDALDLLPLNKRPLVVFVTAHEQFALHAFRLRALDYLLKPIDDERLTEALDRAREAIALRRGHTDTPLVARHPSRFTIRTGYRVQVVATDDIDWIEAMDDYSGLHVGGTLHLLREPLGRLARTLDPKRFVRIHRSTIVRLDRIVELRALPNRDCLLCLVDGTPLRASRTYADALRAALEERS